MTSIGSGAFRDCSSLTSVEISDLANWCQIQTSSWDTFGSDFKTFYLNGEELAGEIIIPDNTTYIASHALHYCKGITSIVLGKKVKSLGFRALPASTLTSVTFKAATPIKYSSMYHDTSSFANVEKIIVPYGTSQVYRENWAAEGAAQNILDKIVEFDREAHVSDINTSMSKINAAKKDHILSIFN